MHTFICLSVCLFQLAKPPPLDRPIVQGRGRNAQLPRPFPVITPQSYVPGGGAGPFPPYPPPRMPNSFPPIGPNSYLPPPGGLEPPIMNYSGGSRMMPPPMLPPPMPYPAQPSMSMVGPPPMYDPGPRPCRRRPTRVCRRPRRSRRCRPVIRIVESDSCSSLSSYTTISSCSPRRCHSRSHSRRCRAPSAPPQQPIILMPVPAQQPAAVAAAPPAPPPPAPVQSQFQAQPQQIILPPIRIQQQGQIDQNQFSIPQISLPQGFGQLQQQQPLTLSPMQLNGSNLITNTNASPMILSGGQSIIQPSLSLPQVTSMLQPQQLQGGCVQYVQAAPQSSSPSTLQYISAEPRSTIAPQRVLVNSTNKKPSATRKSITRSSSTREVAQSDLKYGRRPFDWYDTDKKKNILNENVQVGQRRNTVIS